MASALWVGAIGTGPETSVCYTVDRVIAVELPTTFTCRLRDYVWPTQAPFTVRLRGVELPAEDPNAAAARRFLYERLTHARQVKLTAVSDHGYFQLTADVRVDGCNAAAEMVDYGLMRLSAASVETSISIPENERTYILPDLSNPSEAVEGRRPASVLAQPKMITRLLSQQADLSRIVPETTFQEALSILADSTRPRLPMLVLWNDLQHNALIERDMPVGIGGFGTMQIDKALQLILRSVAPPSVPLAAVAEGGVLTLATRYAVIEKPRVKIYSAADIIAPPSEDMQPQTGSSGGMNR